jgi:hypothetical protein
MAAAVVVAVAAYVNSFLGLVRSSLGEYLSVNEPALED